MAEYGSKSKPDPVGPEGTAGNPWTAPPVTRSDGTPNLNAALARASATFAPIKRTLQANVTYRDKNGKWQKYSFQYAGLDSVYAAVRESLARERLALSHRLIDGGTQLLVSLRHASGEVLESTLSLGKHHEWKELGGAITYATRYAICGLLGVAADDDMDAPVERRYEVHQSNPERTAAKAPPAKRAPSDWATPEQQAQIVKLGKARGMDSSAIAKLVADAKQSVMSAADTIRSLQAGDGDAIAPVADTGGEPF